MAYVEVCPYKNVERTLDMTYVFYLILAIHVVLIDLFEASIDATCVFYLKPSIPLYNAVVFPLRYIIKYMYSIRF